MSDLTAQEYIDLFADDGKARLALLACSSALRLDDEIARQLIELTAKSHGSSQGLVRRIKDLGCVWKQWDGSWYIAEDVRPYLMARLYVDVPGEIRLRLREHLASYAEERANSFSQDGQLTLYRKREAMFEAAYQRMLIPEQSARGAAALAEIWRTASPEGKQATAESVDYLSHELRRHLENLPAEVLFLQGMAARSKKDYENQRKYFRLVWEKGLLLEKESRAEDISKTYVFTVASHLFGLLSRERKLAEQAMRDSIRWNDDEQNKSKVYHSLGNLLSRNRKRWAEAEEAYKQSLKLDRDDHSKAETWHSLGNLLSRDRKRWAEAEEAYKQSLKLDRSPRSKAETLHSIGKLLAKNSSRWHDAEENYRQSIKLRDNPLDEAYVYHSLGILLSNAGRWPEAEGAFRRSLEIRHTPYDKGQVLASWANHLAKSDKAEDLDRAEEYALEGLRLDPNNPRTRGACERALATVNKKRGRVR